MLSVPGYIVSWLIAFTFFGAAWYVFDRTTLHKVYRVLYNLMHKEPLPEDVKRGFIYGQKANDKLMAATLFSALQSVLVALSLDVYNPIIELFSFFLEIPVMCVGFFIGAWIYPLIEKKHKILAAIDGIEDGSIDVSQEFKRTAQKVHDTVQEVFSAAASVPAPATVVETTTEGGPHGDTSEEDSRDALDRFTKGERDLGSRPHQQ